ncbi:uncharacterized protein LOC120779747 [Bactrocera tryoni]|uniref:uncharacterized protein LOC120779747 n=1 Tax=Bactrocera tryoni TaxID=59916 RepID=UPI001A970C4B|nr:uncharacterized protein LOC120779747 [Bactrocera tryoni]
MMADIMEIVQVNLHHAAAASAVITSRFTAEKLGTRRQIRVSDTGLGGGAGQGYGGKRLRPGLGILPERGSNGTPGGGGKAGRALQTAQAPPHHRLRCERSPHRMGQH